MLTAAPHVCLSLSGKSVPGRADGVYDAHEHQRTLCSGDKRTSSPYSLFRPLRPPETCSGYFLPAPLECPVLLQGPLQRPRALCSAALPCLPLEGSLLGDSLAPWAPATLDCTHWVPCLLDQGSGVVWGPKFSNSQTGFPGVRGPVRFSFVVSSTQHGAAHIAGLLPARTFQTTACHWLIMSTLPLGCL